MNRQMIGELILVAVVGFLCWVISGSRATRRGNQNLLNYARGAGDIISSFGHSLPDPLALEEMICLHAERHGYTVILAETMVGIYRRPDGSRAFTFNANAPSWLSGVDWAAMFMTQLEYQVQKDKSGQFFTNSVIPIPRGPETEQITEYDDMPEAQPSEAPPRRVR